MKDKCNICYTVLPPKSKRRAVRHGRRYYRPTCAHCTAIMQRASAMRATDRMQALPASAIAERDARIAELQKRVVARLPVTPDRRPRTVHA